MLQKYTLSVWIR